MPAPNTTHTSVSFSHTNSSAFASLGVFYPGRVFLGVGSGEHGARVAGELGDGWITDVTSFKDDEIRTAFFEGARSAGKDPAQLRTLVRGESMRRAT